MNYKYRINQCVCGTEKGILYFELESNPELLKYLPKKAMPMLEGPSWHKAEISSNLDCASLEWSHVCRIDTGNGRSVNVELELPDGVRKEIFADIDIWCREKWGQTAEEFAESFLDNIDRQPSIRECVERLKNDSFGDENVHAAGKFNSETGLLGDGIILTFRENLPKFLEKFAKILSDNGLVHAVEVAFPPDIFQASAIERAEFDSGCAFRKMDEKTAKNLIFDNDDVARHAVRTFLEPRNLVIRLEAKDCNESVPIFVSYAEMKELAKFRPMHKNAQKRKNAKAPGM